MKRALITAISLIAITGQARAADKPAEYSQAFCTGFNAAVALEKTRFDNWSTVTMAGIGEGDPAKQTNVAKTATVMVRSVPMYVLLQPLNGKVDIGGGEFVDCTPPAPTPAPQPEPAK
jgi:hypothetical protein